MREPLAPILAALTKRAAEIVTVEHGAGAGYCAVAINGERVTGYGSQGYAEDRVNHDRALLVAAWRGPGHVEERQHAGEGTGETCDTDDEPLTADVIDALTDAQLDRLSFAGDAADPGVEVAGADRVSSAGWALTGKNTIAVSRKWDRGVRVAAAKMTRERHDAGEFARAEIDEIKRRCAASRGKDHERLQDVAAEIRARKSPVAPPVPPQPDPFVPVGNCTACGLPYPAREQLHSIRYSGGDGICWARAPECFKAYHLAMTEAAVPPQPETRPMLTEWRDCDVRCVGRWLGRARVGHVTDKRHLHGGGVEVTARAPGGREHYRDAATPEEGRAIADDLLATWYALPADPAPPQPHAGERATCCAWGRGHIHHVDGRWWLRVLAAPEIVACPFCGARLDAPEPETPPEPETHAPQAPERGDVAEALAAIGVALECAHLNCVLPDRDRKALERARAIVQALAAEAAHLRAEVHLQHQRTTKAEEDRDNWHRSWTASVDNKGAMQGIIDGLRADLARRDAPPSYPPWFAKALGEAITADRAASMKVGDLFRVTALREGGMEFAIERVSAPAPAAPETRPRTSIDSFTVAPARAVEAPETRERAIEECAKSGWRAAKVASAAPECWSPTWTEMQSKGSWISDTERLIGGAAIIEFDNVTAFARAVLAEARRHPILASSPALARAVEEPAPAPTTPEPRWCPKCGDELQSDDTKCGNCRAMMGDGTGTGEVKP
jgi:hypothetical protein